MNFDHLYKILLVGNSGVGKSSILQRFTEDKYPAHHVPTIALDFRSKILELCGKQVKLQIWDSGGEKYRAITSAYYRGAAAVVLVYDVTDRKSFDELKGWMRGMDTDCILALIGNKADAVRVVPTEDGREYARRHNMLFYEIGGGGADRVHELFITLTERILEYNGILRSVPPRSVGVPTVSLSGETTEQCTLARKAGEKPRRRLLGFACY